MIKSIHTIETGNFKLDGGAMFGVVPKSMWNKLNPADENNMCSWSLRCLLIQTDDRNILVDTGMGNKQDAKFRSHFYPHGTGELMHSLAEHDLKPEDITDVILTHLHFDHCGGAVKFNEQKELVPSFPNATYWSNKTHWDWSIDPNERERNSFLKENFVPLQEANVLQFIEEANDIVPFVEGINIHFCSGHTKSLMAVEINCNGKNYIYPTDLFPSSCHVPIPYVMAYDIQPLLTLVEKKKMLDHVVFHNSIMIFEHDPNVAACNFKINDKGKVVVDSVYTNI